MSKLNEQPVKEITVQELNKLFEDKADFQLIDVREQFESDVASIGGKLIPLGKIYFHLAQIAKDRQVIIYCRSGRRSADAVKLLQEATGNKNLFNLKGGIIEWAEKIDKTVSIEL